MKISAKARLVSVIVAVVFMFGALVGTGTYLIINHLNSSATTETDYIMTTNLFNTDGTINTTAADTLLEAVGYYDHAATTTPYKAHQITTRSTSTNTGNTIIFPMGYYNGTSTPLYWQATYLYNNYLTVWLNKCYTTSTWNSSSVTVSYSTYANSTIQSYLDDTLWDDLTQNSSELRSVFALPSTVGYQTSGSESLAYNNSDTSYYYSSSYTSKFDNLASSVRSGSYLWLPSFGEVFNNTSSSYTSSTTSYTGQWGLNSTDRAFSTSSYDSGSDSYCWLRSGYSGGNSRATQVSSSGSAGVNIVGDSYGVRPAAHLSLSALEEAMGYTITVESDNEDYGTVSGGGLVPQNSSVTLTATPKIGYHFVRWERNGTQVSTSASYTFTATGSYTYTAFFEPNSYTITTNVSPAGAGSVSGGGAAYNYNTQATLNATANSGYEFVGWDINGNNQYDSGEPTANPYLHTVTGAATITAIFRQLINITIHTNNAEYGQIFVNGSLTTSTTITQDANTQISNIMALVKNNCAFLYWYDENTGSIYTDNPLNYTVTQNTTLTAYFDSGLVDGVAVSVESILGDTVAIGEARITGYANIDGVDYVHFSAVAYTGYRFVGWRIDGEILAGYTESADIPYSMVENKQVFAVFAPIDNSNINNDTDNNQADDII